MARVRHVQRKRKKQRSGGGAAIRVTGKNRRRVIRVRPSCRQDVQDSDEEWCNDEGDDDSGTESERSSDDDFVQDDEAVSRRLRRMEASGARVCRSSGLGFTAEEQGTATIHSSALVSQGIIDSPAGRDEFMNAKDKGKEKVDELDVGIVCGICFTEEIEVDRGKLDCCEHFFCFACILEWSKVESKCPICKQRFVTILKPARAGVTSSRSRTVRIPTRNQVYVPSQEELRELTDPYATTVCAECLQPGDDALLLLCDACDVAAHTYCVGLGASVPRGDWFCSTCSSAIGDAYGSSDVLSDEYELEESKIMEEDFIRSVVRTASRRWKRPRQRQSRTHQERRTQSSQGLRVQNAGQLAALDEVRDNVLSSGPSARTLSSQRVVQQRIQYIRQSWDSLRNGAASFPRMFQDSTSNSLRDMSRHPVERQQMGSSSATTCTIDSVVSGTANSDVDRAWQMMERARSMIPHQQNMSTTRSLPASGARGSGTSSLCSNSTKKLTCRSAPGSHPTAPNNSQIRSTDSTKESQASTCNRSSNGGKGTETTDGKSMEKSTLVEEERRSKRLKSRSDSEQHEQKQQSDGKSTEKSTLVEEERRSKRFKSRFKSEQHEQKQQADLKEHHTGTSEQHHKVHGQLPAAKASPTEQSKRRAVKEQLSNIVKLELKTFYVDKKIGKEQYKDIARSATHVLLGMVHDSEFDKHLCCDNETMKSRAKEVVEKILKSRKLN